jgi:hypothetical protein
MLGDPECPARSVTTLWFVRAIDNEWREDGIASSTPLSCNHRLAAVGFFVKNVHRK